MSSLQLNRFACCAGTGDNFGTSGASVSAGGKLCLNVRHNPGNETRQISCFLPAGVGSNVQIVVNQGQFGSIPGFASVELTVC